MQQHKQQISKSLTLLLLFLLLSPFSKAQDTKGNVIAPPLTFNDTVLIGKNQEILIDVLANDFDPDGDINPATLNNTTFATIGLVSIENNKFRYTPGTNVCGIDSFTYIVKDFTNTTSNTAKVIINISCFNLAPVANNDTLIIDEDTIDSVDVFDNDRYTDGPGVLYTIVENGKLGNAFFTSGRKLNYYPNANVFGMDSVKYSYCDNGIGDELCDTAYVIIYINPINDAPVAINDTLTAYRNTNLKYDVSLNDTSIDGPQHNYSLLNTPVNGTASISTSGLFDYNPTVNFIGNDSILYRVCDGASSELCTNAKIYIQVKPIFALPQAVNDTLRVIFGTSNGINILANDNSIDGNLLSDSVFFLSELKHGTFNYEDSVFTYQPDPGFTGKDSIHYRIKNSVDSLSLTSKISILVNRIPILNNDCSHQTIQAESLVIDVFKFATPTTASLNKDKIYIIQDPEHGILNNYNSFSGTITYNPNPNFSGIDTFYYYIKDIDAFASDTAAICIEVKDGLPIHIPKLITPNNDGINDYWTFPGIENFPDNEVVIFDRNGLEIFRTKAYSDSNFWDAGAVLTGTYFYVLKIKHRSTEKVYKGYITLLK